MSNFHSMDHILGIICKNCLTNPKSWGYLSYVFSFSSYICYIINFELIFVYDMRQGSKFVFYIGISNCVSTLCQKDYFSPSLGCLGTFINVRIYFCIPNHFSLIYISFLLSVLHYFEFCIIISFEIEKISPLSVFFKWFELFLVLSISI